jgi:hypothetical protein
MALTSSERTKIRLYLGYANLHRYLNTRLEGAFDAIDADAETEIRAIMAELVTVEAAIAAAGAVAAGSDALKKVDEVEFYGPKESQITIVDAPARGRMLLNKLSIMFGVPFKSKYFGGGGYSGDRFSDELGLGDSNSSVTRLG